MRSIDVPPTCPASFRPLLVVRAVVVAIVTSILLVGCGDPPAEESADPVEALPELATIGGVQDVWNFPFGFNDDRDAVRDVIGEANEVVIELVDAIDDEPWVEEWYYDGFEVDFYVDPVQSIDYVLAATVTSDEVDLRGGLAVGMTADEAVELLGEPQPGTGNDIVYFYMTTSIVLTQTNGKITSITLARALP